MNCSNLCFHSKHMCEYCKKNYNVSSEFYIGKRPVNGCYVVGYLVKNKQGEIQGILNKNTQFKELAWVDESTIKKVLL